MSSSPASHPIAFSAASSPYSSSSCADAHDTMTSSYSYPNPTATAGVYSTPPELVYPGEDSEHQQMYTAPSYPSMATSQPPTWSTSPLAKKQQLAMSQQYAQQQSHHPAYASAGHHHSQSSSSPVPSPVPQDFSDDWQRTGAGSYQLSVQQQAASQSGYRVKSEEQPPIYASGYSRPVYDMSGHFQSSQHQQPQYSPAGVMPGYYQLSHQPGAHERYIHPADLSPVEQHYPMSPLRVGHSPSQPGCDPRYVTGDIGVAHDIDGRHELDADGDEDSVDQETFEETTTPSDTHEEDYEDVDYDDDRDGDFVLRRSRVSNSARRSLRPRSNPDRYAPYSYPVDTFGAANPLGITTRTRRTISNATDSSVGSSASSSSAYPPPPLQGVRRRARSSASLPAPVPVPNLTKKSRGRRVPTVSVLDTKRDAEFRSSSKGARVHTCKVPGCGKCFARGEHLKRHVRSIHTYEKPHKCPYPGCGKDFSRHDNLGQHMRVHKDYRP